MKMVKSLLLGTAAGLVAMAGAQAADLPVKAKPVQYVKICSLYGDGYYYIPGTDTCLKIGGYVRVQLESGAATRGVADIVGGAQGAQTRATLQYGFLARGSISADARSQTEYGTLRSYIEIQVQDTDTTAAAGEIVNTTGAFIQFAGFTVGIAPSFYDFMSYAPYHYGNPRVGSNLGAAGQPVFGYTAQLGNGLSASLAVEDVNSRRNSVIDGTAAGTAAFTATTMGTAPVTDQAAQSMPDITANLRVDQVWGSAQLMGALHQVSALYYGAPASAATLGIQGHPGDKIGTAIGAGLKLNIPGMPGDVLWLQGNWSKGATAYATNVAYFNKTNAGAGTLGYGIASDAVFGAVGTDLELTTAWNIGGIYEHRWSPTLRTAAYAGYTKFEYSATANAQLCTLSALAAMASCQNNFAVWSVGARTEWTPAKNINIGLDVWYTKLNTASAGTSTAVSSTAISNPVTAIADQDAWAVAMRWQRNFYP